MSAAPSAPPSGLTLFKKKKKSTFEENGDDVTAAAEVAVNAGALRPYQLELTKEATDHFARGVAAVAVVLPTGAGKSGIAVLVPYFVKSRKVLYVAPSVEMATQLAADVCAGGDCFLNRIFGGGVEEIAPPRTGTLVSSTTEMGDLAGVAVIVVNAQKFSRVNAMDTNDALDKIAKDHFDLVIIDEAHHYPAPTWTRICEHFGSAKKLFMTATPAKLAGVNALVTIGDKYTRQVCIENGYIRDIRLEEVDDRSAMFNAIISSLIAHDQRDQATKHKALIIVHSQEEATAVTSELSGLFRQHDWTVENYVGKVDSTILPKFKLANNFRCLVISGRLLEGFSLPSISVLGIDRNIGPKSQVLFTQFVGRAVRTLKTDNHLIACLFAPKFRNQQRNYESFITPVLPEHDPDENDEAQ